MPCSVLFKLCNPAALENYFVKLYIPYMTYIAMCRATHRVDMSEINEREQHIVGFESLMEFVFCHPLCLMH